ncbi:acyltransferase family protein [Roseicella frigidaeris]|uniref:Acyltransferase 3 domain-containing protein n=1 Tax=Roseicella frigidaeris TaxID=2230885 RepID=A0A327LV69_9PROT|nr:acyltransferase [Roseicella frigidaeris]RAI54671.1 hypothetical protein DOO78_25505 [Roseicella frigidaeris]
MQPFPAYFCSLLQSLGRRPSSGRYRPELDGLRCMAILIVMIWHASLKIMRFTATSGITESVDNPKVAWIPDGAVGVALFFFLSGMVICRPFLSGTYHTTKRSLQDFYRSRLIRIVPPYALVLLSCYLVIGVLGHTPERASTFEVKQISPAASLGASLFYLHGLIFSSPPRLSPPGWSLEIEMQFYLIAPALIVAYLALRHRMSRLLLGIAVIIGSVVLRLWLVETYGEYGRFRWTLLNYFPVFMLGIVVADLTRAEEVRPSHETLPDMLCLGSVLLLLLPGIFRHPVGWTERLAADAATLAALVGLYYGVTRGRIANRLFSLRALTIIGTACYSIYLTHVPLMHFVGQLFFKLVQVGDYPSAWSLGLLLLLPLSLIFGMIFHILVERPFVQLAANRPVPEIRGIAIRS